MKKSLTILLALCLILSVLMIVPLSAGARTSGDFQYKVHKDFTAEITGYTGDAAELVVPSELDGFAVISIGELAFFGCTNLMRVTIPDSVTHIGKEAFEDCSGLKRVVIGRSVSCIDDYAFYGCTDLTEILIPDAVTRIGKGAFEGCTDLSSLTIGCSVETIGDRAFDDCVSLQSVTIPDSVTSIGREAFADCPDLTEITIPSSVTTIDRYAFGYYYSNPTEPIKIGGFTIYGEKDSEAERYANESGFTFIPVGSDRPDNPQKPTETEKPSESGEQPFDVIRGDTDGDGKVTILDATAIQRILAGIPTTAFDEDAADADGDGEVTILDATAIQRYLAGMPTNEHIGKPIR